MNWYQIQPTERAKLVAKKQKLNEVKPNKSNKQMGRKKPLKETLTDNKKETTFQNIKRFQTQRKEERRRMLINT